MELDYKMKTQGWKTTAIIFIILFGVLLAYNIWAISYVFKEEARTNECYYNVCSDYVDAWYSEKICYCYENDLLGNQITAKTKVME